jgi:hypothetical protein
MRFEWKKHEKELYSPTANPCLINIPKQKFFTLKGRGNPNEKDFSERVGVLYALSYAVRMMPKNGFEPVGYFEYTVYPLEGIWDLTEGGKTADSLNKDELLYTIMIRQPDFVDADVANRAIEMTKKKKPHPILDEVEFGEIEDGLCVQVLHNGSYDDEPASFKKMIEFIKNRRFQRRNFAHREIYISDARKVEKDKLKTVLRYFVAEK